MGNIESMNTIMRTTKVTTGKYSNSENRVLATEVHEGFKRVDEKFIAVDRRFETILREMDLRFESQHREMVIRFEAVDHKFSIVYWMIGTGFALVLSALSIIMKFVIP